MAGELRASVSGLVLVLSIAVLACGGESGPRMLWDPGGGVAVFPDDAWTVVDPAARTGLRPDVDPSRIAELADVPDTYKDIFRDLSTLDGFGLTAGITVRFDAAIDPASIVSGPATADLASSIVLVVEDGATLRPWPYEAMLTDEDFTVILEPMIPLPPATEVYVAVTDRVRPAAGGEYSPSPAMAAALDGDGVDEMAARVAPRIAAAAGQLVAGGWVESIDELLGLVVFTTQSTYQDALAIADHISSQEIAPAAGTSCVVEASWQRCDGSFAAVDYRGLDGMIEDIAANGDGLDASVTYELPFTIWLPLERPGPYGGEAFPVLIFGHGLGSGRTQGERLAEFAAPRGMATIAIDALRHGNHPTATSHSTLARTLDFFGISTFDMSFEPLEMREQFRQSTYDKLQLLRLIAGGIDVDGDEVIDLDPSRISYLGVSLGGIMGPEFLALAPEITAAVLVVPGGRVSSIVSDAEQFSIVIDIMKPPETSDGEVDRFFPVLQTVIDRGDAAVWAVDLLAAIKPDGFPTSTPHLLMGMVLDDDTVPNTANRFLARSLDIPVVPPLRQEIGLVGMTGEAPVSANLPGGRTGGLLQFDRVLDGDGTTEPATHSNIGDSEVGAEAWFHFLDSQLMTGTPVIVDPYAELGIP